MQSSLFILAIAFNLGILVFGMLRRLSGHPALARVLNYTGLFLLIAVPFGWHTVNVILDQPSVTADVVSVFSDGFSVGGAHATIGFIVCSLAGSITITASYLMVIDICADVAAILEYRWFCRFWRRQTNRVWRLSQQ
jgi:hypothetical protein